MELPKNFMPKHKNLEKNIERLLSKKYIPLLNHLEIDPEIKTNVSFFDKGLEILKNEGYERYLRPWESFRLLTDFFENKLQKKSIILAEKIVQSRGEWFSMALRRRGDKLLCYVDPEGIKWNQDGPGYTSDKNFKFNYRLSRELNIGNIPSEEWVALERFDEDFVKYFYTQSFETLPEKVMERKNVAVYLPSEGILSPICRSDLDNLGMGCLSFGATRGVRIKNTS